MSLSNTTLSVSRLLVSLEYEAHLPCDKCGFMFYSGDTRVLAGAKDGKVQRPVLCEMCVEALFDTADGVIEELERGGCRAVTGYIDVENEVLTDLTAL